MKRINTLVLGIITASLTGLSLISAQASISDPNWVLDRVVIAERGGSPVEVIGLNSSGEIDWSNSSATANPYGVGFSALAINNGRLYAADTEPYHRVIEYDLTTGAMVATLISNQNLINQPGACPLGRTVRSTLQIRAPFLESADSTRMALHFQASIRLPKPT